jgi:CheY-like chemotaxis protein
MKRVLVVDDERDVTDSLGELLGETYHVTLAYNGVDALRMLEANIFDAVVLDLMMPVMSGEKLMTELRTRGILVPVILASAASDLSERAERSHAHDFIAKPFDLHLLERKLAKLLGAGGAGGSFDPGPKGGPGPSKPPEGHGARHQMKSRLVSAAALSI